jgi:metal-sulfur cluster biosynthetic enzyme
MSFITEENKKEIQIYDALKSVIDPEVGINIVDLGLIYKIKYHEKEGILIDMTLSTRACPMGDIIQRNVVNVIQALFPETKVTVNLVWQPSWNTSFITPAGKKALDP